MAGPGSTVIPLTGNTCYDKDEVTVSCSSHASDSDLSTGLSMAEGEAVWRTVKSASLTMNFSEYSRFQREQISNTLLGSNWK